jgi:hypothetical protein
MSCFIYFFVYTYILGGVSSIAKDSAMCSVNSAAPQVPVATSTPQRNDTKTAGATAEGMYAAEVEGLENILLDADDFGIYHMCSFSFFHHFKLLEFICLSLFCCCCFVFLPTILLCCHF